MAVGGVVVAACATPTTQEPGTTCTERSQVVAFLGHEVPAGLTEALIADINGEFPVDCIKYVTKDEAFAEAMEIFADNEGARRAIEADRSLVPASLRIALTDRGEVDRLAEFLRQRSEVQEFNVR
jgi:cell division protein FtsX